jgi:regulator of protease activity HflC (stomatin/prohibitin superfamily)
MTTKGNNFPGINIDKKSKILGIIFIIVLIFAGVSVGYFFLAFDTVGYNEYALNQDGISQEIEDKVYEKGFYHIGIFNHFIKFPKTVQTIDFKDSYPLNSRTKDGLLINVRLSFQYRLRKADILILYGTFALDYEARFIGQARTSLRDVTSNYNAIEFFNNRTIIGDRMFEYLITELDEMFADVVYFQLREIDLPDEFEEALKQVQIAQQQYQIALYEQQAAIVNAETAIIEAQANANITILTAEAEAEAYIINMEAQATALNITLTAERMAYYAMGQQLNLTSTELLALLWIMVIQEHDESMLILGSNTPILIETVLNNTKSI